MRKSRKDRIKSRGGDSCSRGGTETPTEVNTKRSAYALHDKPDVDAKPTENEVEKVKDYEDFDSSLFAHANAVLQQALPLHRKTETMVTEDLED